MKKYLKCLFPSPKLWRFVYEHGEIRILHEMSTKVLLNMFSRVLLNLSTIPFEFGWYGLVPVLVIFKVLHRCILNFIIPWSNNNNIWYSEHVSAVTSSSRRLDTAGLSTGYVNDYYRFQFVTTKNNSIFSIETHFPLVLLRRTLNSFIY